MPPPHAGPELASKLLVEAVTPHLPHAVVENASVRRTNMSKGRLDFEGITGFARAYRRFVRRLPEVDVLYITVAANTVACLRDAVLVLTARVLGKQIIIHMRGGHYVTYYATSAAVMRWILRRSWGSARKAIVQTPGLGRDLRGVAPRTEIVVLPNALRGTAHVTKQDYATATPRVLFVGHLTFAKGFYDLMHAFRTVRRVCPEAKLMCAGELPSPERAFADLLPRAQRDAYLRNRHRWCEEIRAFVSSGAAEGVEYVGVVDGDAKTRLFTSADVFALPSYSEGFSMALLEAMFHGLPVIATRCGGSPDIIADDRNGRLVNPGDPDGLTRALLELLRDPGARETMGRRNASEARACYELDGVARRFATIFEGL
jgi:glycosyltransferase involved in cell wall biosynthesis